MATCNAIVVSPGEKAIAIQEVPVPKVLDDWILVDTKAVALNPGDWKVVDYALADAGSRVGSDYAGVVVDVGNNVTQYQKGDRVAGFCHGGNRKNHNTGAFGNKILVKASASIKIPSNMDYVQAATIGAGTFTCGLGLYHSLQLPLPGQSKEKFPILIHGGGTATGMWAVQFAKLSGLTVITTASPANFDYLLSLGADHVFDYHSPTCGADIRALTNNKLLYAWDCPGGGEELCTAALSSDLPSKYGVLNLTSDRESLRALNPMVEGPLLTTVYNILGEEWDLMGSAQMPDLESFRFTLKFKEIVRSLLEKGQLKAPRVGLNIGGMGLEGVIKGLDQLKQGKVRSQKLVYTLE